MSLFIFLIALFVLRACCQSSRVLSKDHSQKASQLFQGTRSGLSDESKKGAKFENLYFCRRNFRFSCKYGIFNHSEYRVTILNRLKNLCARWKWDLTEIRAFLENRKNNSWRSFSPDFFFLCLPSRFFLRLAPVSQHSLFLSRCHGFESCQWRLLS